MGPAARRHGGAAGPRRRRGARPSSRSVRTARRPGPTLLPLPAAAAEDHAPLTRRATRWRCWRSRWRDRAAHDPDHPELGRALSQPGTAPHRGRSEEASHHDAHRARRRRQRRVHPQPAGRHPVVPGAARRRARPPRHRRRSPADGRAHGRLDGRRRWVPRPRITATSIAARRSPVPTSSSTPSRSAARGRRRSTSTSRRRYGLRYTINDTINVGGVLRGLRTIPVVLGIAADMEDVCPDAMVPQLHQPDGRCSSGP